MAIPKSLKDIADKLPEAIKVTKVKRSEHRDEIEMYEPPENQSIKKTEKPTPQQNSYGSQKEDRFMDLGNFGTSF